MPEPVVDQVIGKYRILGRLGEGGMATVYKAYDPSLQRYVAIKVLSDRFVSDEQILRRFEREATTAANLKHPNIVVIHDVGSAGRHHFIVMELLEGPTLRDEIRALGLLPPERVAPILLQLGSALDYAHQQGLIHRDVKPGNVILGLGDHTTLTDFGLVRSAQLDTLTQAGAALGTLHYMSPEQLMGDVLDHRADVYSLGAVVYECLSGRLPFVTDMPYGLIQAIMTGTPPPIATQDISQETEQVVLQALAKSPADRFKSAGEFALAFNNSLHAQELDLASSSGALFRLPRSQAGVGRDADNEIVIDNAQVSRHHALIRFDGVSWFLTDMQSTNGTFVNNKRLLPGQPQRLQAGDWVQFGPHMVFQVVAHRITRSSSSTSTMSATRPTKL